MEIKHLYLKPNETKLIAMLIVQYQSDAKVTRNNPAYLWTPEARKMMREMDEAAEQLKTKFQKLGYDMSEMEPYKEGDEDEFLTK